MDTIRSSQQVIPQPAGRFAIVNGTVILPQAIVRDKAVIVEGSKIVDVADVGTVGENITKIDAGGRYVSPGLIDIHTHGAVSHSFNEPGATAWEAITCENVSRGVTSMLATIATAPIPDLVACLKFSHEWMSGQHDGAQIIGVHLEGPYFSYAQRGAQNPEALRTPDDGTADVLLEHHDVMRIMSFAPELPGALDLTARLAKLSIVPAGGHSSAKDTEVLAAIKAGLRHTIHIWSGQSTTIREGPWRKPGILEATLTFDGLTAEMISDNKHLPPTLMKLAYKCPGPDRLCAISDATNGAGLPDGTLFQMAV